MRAFHPKERNEKELFQIHPLTQSPPHAHIQNQNFIPPPNLRYLLILLRETARATAPLLTAPLTLAKIPFPSPNTMIIYLLIQGLPLQGVPTLLITIVEKTNFITPVEKTMIATQAIVVVVVAAVVVVNHIHTTQIGVEMNRLVVTKATGLLQGLLRQAGEEVLTILLKRDAVAISKLMICDPERTRRKLRLLTFPQPLKKI
jgi:hypothetical protein